MSIRLPLSSVLLALTLAACGGEPTPPSDPATTVATVTINTPKTALAVGSTLQLTADAANAAGTILVDKTITWVSSRADVATVTSLGLVTGVATGTTVITATSERRKGTVTLTVQAPNKITLTSDAGDFIGAGGNYVYTNANALIQLRGNATSIELSIEGNERWNATFRVPTGSQLAPGTYANATRWPFQGNGAGLSWYGQGRGCNQLTGSFTIDSLTWNGAAGTSLAAVAFRFEQHCEGGAPALRGNIHWRADDPSTGPGPVVPIPTNLWQPPAGATPASGNYVYLQSEPGDYVGQGATTLYQSGIAVSGNGRLARVSAGGYSGNFLAMNSIGELKVGYYSGLTRYGFNNPVLGGLEWSGNGRGCGTLTGWFVVDAVKYVNGALTALQLRFEQHCLGQGPALHGAVRWGEP